MKLVHEKTATITTKVNWLHRLLPARFLRPVVVVEEDDKPPIYLLPGDAAKLTMRSEIVGAGGGWVAKDGA